MSRAKRPSRITQHVRSQGERCCSDNWIPKPRDVTKALEALSMFMGTLTGTHGAKPSWGQSRGRGMEKLHSLRIYPKSLQMVDCSHEIKRCSLLGRKVMTNLDRILKIRDITLPTKVHLVKAMVFPVVTYGCESCTIKKSEHRRIDAFEQWCWRRLLRVRWTARRSSQSILKEISPKYSLVGLMLKLKLQYLGHLMQRTDSLKKTLMLGRLTVGEGDDRGWEGWMASLTQWHEFE